jgi:hypothetical protein
MRALVAIGGLLGGACWLAAYAVGAGGSADALTWAGAALLAVATLGAGASLVSRGATWLRVVAAVCFLALVASVREVLRDGSDPPAVDAVAGAAAVLVAVVALTRRRESRGSHAR